jgi:hypothetical protein
LLLALLLALAACGGGGKGGDGTPATPTGPAGIDDATAGLWSGWADDAYQIGALLAQMYQSGGLVPDRTAGLQGQARTLAKEIRDGEPSDSRVAGLADDLDQLADDLDFGLEYARNAGLPVINIFVPGFRESLQRLLNDSVAVSDMLENP